MSRDPKSELTLKGAPKPARRPTVNDVAARAGVSIGTVSNVLNGVIPVREKTRQRVIDAIAELDYRQDLLAQGLRARRTPIVGLCVPHTSITYFAGLVDAFEEVASDDNVAIMQVLSRQDSEREYQRINSLLDYRVGGLIWVPSLDPEATYELVRASGIPTVVVDRAPEGDFPFDKVTFDNRAAMHRTAAGLIQRGHENLLFVVHQRLLYVTQQRIAGLQEAVQTAPGPIRTKVIECADQNSITASLAVEMRRSAGPTAIVVSNSKLAAWLYRAMGALGLRCPEDISVVAFDEPEWADIVSPSLSVVRQPTRDIAVMAWHVLLNRMSDDVQGVQSIQLQAEIVFRNSVRDFVHGERAS